MRGIRLCGLRLSLIVLCTGCGSAIKTDYRQLNLVQVWGRVTLDAKPLADGMVVFESPDRSYSWARTNSSGKYRLMFNSQKRGVTPGPKVVRIFSATGPGEESAPVEGEELPTTRQPELVPACYNTNSMLKVTVGKRSHAADFDLISQGFGAIR